jgi:predicted ArsR family transcriptional regulator
LCQPPEYTPKTADAVGSKLDIPAQKAKEHLDKLERRNYVREHLFVGRPKEYSIAPTGREYLTKHDLLKKR